MPIKVNAKTLMLFLRIHQAENYYEILRKTFNINYKSRKSWNQFTTMSALFDFPPLRSTMSTNYFLENLISQRMSTLSQSKYHLRLAVEFLWLIFTQLVLNWEKFPQHGLLISSRALGWNQKKHAFPHNKFMLSLTLCCSRNFSEKRLKAFRNKSMENIFPSCITLAFSILFEALDIDIYVTIWYRLSFQYGLI